MYQFFSGNCIEPKSQLHSGPQVFKLFYENIWSEEQFQQVKINLIVEIFTITSPTSSNVEVFCMKCG